MSAFSMGARMGRRRPGPKRMLSSTVAASAMPCSTMEMASRHSACCRRLATNPGTSFLQSMGRLPTRRSRSMVRSTTPGSTCSVRTTSTSGIRYGGFQKWVPTTRSLCAALAPISVMLMTEVLVHRMVSGGQAASSRSKTSCLRARSSNTHSTTTSAPSTASARSVVVRTRPTASSTPPAGNRPCSARKDRFAVSAPGARSRASSYTSWSATSCPAAAKTWATPTPIMPPPMTAMRSAFSVQSGAPSAPRSTAWLRGCSRPTSSRAGDQPAVLPPSTAMISPVTKSEAAEAR